MKRILVLIAIVMLATGCGPKAMVKVEYRDKLVPVNTTPAPPDVTRPVLETSKLTPADRKDLGIVAKALVVEDKQLLGYVDILEAIINKYKEAAKNSPVKSLLDVTGINVTPYQPVPKQPDGH